MTPAVASQREYLRAQLPAVFLAGADPLAPSLLRALEEVLDPIVATIEALPAYLDPELAPPPALALLGAWLGVDAEEDWLEPRRRATVRNAARLAARRGTRGGLEEALAIAFPSLPLRIDDSGGVRWREEERDAPIAEPVVNVHCDTPLDEPDQRALLRCINDNIPAGVRAHLRVLARRRGEGDTS